MSDNTDMRDTSLSHQCAVVTGGGTGIGLAIAQQLALAGAHVAIAGRRTAVLAEAAGETLLYQTVDVANRDSVSTLFRWALEVMPSVDVLVNAAGINIPNRTMERMAPEDWDRLMAVNATGAYNCMHAILPHMRERRSGLIVNISSISGKRAWELGGIAYCASKFAMTGLGTAVGLEESKHGIRVTNVYPGEVDTPLLESRPAPVGAEHRARILKPIDIATMIVSLVRLPQHVHVPEIVIKPLWQPYA